MQRDNPVYTFTTSKTELSASPSWRHVQCLRDNPREGSSLLLHSESPYKTEKLTREREGQRVNTEPCNESDE